MDLPEVAAKVGDKLTILIDGGFRRGSDVVKALLLGADAVLLGRATLYGLAAGGEAGAAHAINILQTEVDRVLGLLGFPDITIRSPPSRVSVERGLSRAHRHGWRPHGGIVRTPHRF